MEGVICLGLLVMFAAGGFGGTFAIVYGLRNPTSGWGKFVTKTWPFPTPSWIQNELASSERRSNDLLAEVARPVDPEQTLRSTKSDGFVTILGKSIPVWGKLLLLELQSFGKEKSNKVHVNPSGGELREFQAFTLSGDKLLIEQPQAEGDELAWFLYERIPPRGVSEFMAGTESAPGPAVRFAKSDQKADVKFELVGATWAAQDIAWVDCQCEGRTFVKPGSDGKLPRVAILLSRCVDDEDEWLMFADLRSGQGSDTLWRGRKFDPQVELE